MRIRKPTTMTKPRARNNHNHNHNHNQHHDWREISTTTTTTTVRPTVSLEHACSRRLLLLWLLLVHVAATITTATATGVLPSNHTSNHAVIVSTSRYWFNYRHANNALAIYNLVKENGIPDSNIVLMIADDYPTNPRNPAKNGMYMSSKGAGSNGALDETKSFYSATTQIDYRGDDVTVDNIRKVLLGTNYHGNPVLHTDETSNILIYWTGHGGDQFFKFQDVEEITSHDLAHTFDTMHAQRKYNEILFVTDTCQANTLYDHIVAPNVHTIGSSLRNQNSYAHHSLPYLGLSVIERYTFAFWTHLERNKKGGGVVRHESVKHAMVDIMSSKGLRSTVGFNDDNCYRKLDQIPLSDFFAALPETDSERAQFLTLSNSNSHAPSVLSSWSNATTPTDPTHAPFRATTHPEQRSRRLERRTPAPLLQSKKMGKPDSNSRGVDPTDVRFVTCIVALVSAVVTLSKRL